MACVVFVCIPQSTNFTQAPDLQRMLLSNDSCGIRGEREQVYEDGMKVGDVASGAVLNLRFYWC